MDLPEGSSPPRKPRTWRATSIVLVGALVAAAVGTVLWARDPAGVSPPFDSGNGCNVEDREVEPRAADSVDEQIRQTKRDVAAIRNLSSGNEVVSEVVRPEELVERLLESLDEYPDERFERDAASLELLGIVDEDFDIRALYEDLYSSAVAGVYFPDEDRLYVGTRSPDAPLPGGELSTLAHELQHALVDQVFGLPESEQIPRGEEDAALAEHSLFEGDATLTQQLFMQHGMTAEQRAGILDDPALAEQLQEYFALPFYFRSFFEFPYTHGLRFVQALCRRGGWEAVDEAYERRPATTAQILFPERYFEREEPDEPPMPRAPARWGRGYPIAIGAADLLIMLQAPGGERNRALDDPMAAARAWAGGRFTLWQDDEEEAGLLQLIERPDADLCAPITAWYLASFPDVMWTHDAAKENYSFDHGDRAALLQCKARNVSLAIAPNEADAAALLEDA